MKISFSKTTATLLAASLVMAAGAAMAQTSQPTKTSTPAAPVPKVSTTPDKPLGIPSSAEAPADSKTATMVKTKLLKPSELNEKAPATFKVKFTTSAGDF